MSVVNKMLQDLEARQTQTDEIQADYQAPPKKQSKLLVLLLLILALAAIIFALTDIDSLFGDTKSNQVKATTDSQALPAKATNKMTMVSEKVAPAPIHVKDIKNQPVKANISTQTPDTEIQLPNEVLAEKATPLQKSHTATNQIQPIDSQGESIETTTKAEPLNETAASSFSKTDTSQENNSNSLKQRIVESLNDDDLDLAKSLLYELLETEPTNIKARKKLASLQFAQGNYAQSKQLLVQGIELHPVQSDLRLMLARLYMVQKAPSQAINILTEFQPSTGNQVEYLGYRAALAQQLKQTKLAMSDYQSLTIIESTNAKWWLGLGIAKDQLGETNMAVKAYTKALSLDQLDSSVNDFIRQRISVLAGAQ
ncbi:tetratricopeptide repeat protein [uncultured Paraglaciecola sp.]|uniref:tetratricopeptide repeat protein n=1 Tax=uncultured Paraglaciecola sp. TaxID=1765024 RepID=UPI0030DA2DF9|tara:strand:- start:42324 stop:43430 length:1107 start_codon:yes stop_codon:yes gene_type:complete